MNRKKQGEVVTIALDCHLLKSPKLLDRYLCMVDGTPQSPSRKSVSPIKKVLSTRWMSSLERGS